jgi:hypothetical protein
VRERLRADQRVQALGRDVEPSGGWLPLSQAVGVASASRDARGGTALSRARW